MPSRYRVALQGFSEFERTTLAFCIHHAASRKPGYVQVELIADSDFIVADASHEPIAGSVTRGERMADTLFVGDKPPFGAGAHLQRPIDPERILRALDKMAATKKRRSSAAVAAPDIVLPLDAPGARSIPFADSESADTAPAAFQHEPLSFAFGNLDLFDAVEPAVGSAVGSAVELVASSVPAAEGAKPIGAADPVATSLHAAVETSTSMASIARAAALIVPDAGINTPPAPAPEAPPPSAPDPALTRPALREPKVPAKPLTPAAVPKRDAAAAVAATVLPAAKPHEPRPRLNATERAEAKAAARRASRHARVSQAAGAADAPCDVLLLDSAPEPAALGPLLEAFGFLVHRADSIAAAMAVLERTPLAAAFLDVAAQDLTGIDGLDLCQRIKHRQVPLAGAVPAVMLLSDRDSAAGRVRAKLAGCDAFLVRPVERGAVARVLESCNVAMPADARRS